MKQISPKHRAEWRRWLAQNHNKVPGIWLVFHKKQTGKPTLDYEAMVEEALCYGWIDSIVKKLDDDRYARKLTPRKSTSRWSESNKRRVAKLIRQGRMTKFGLAKIDAAKQTGLWTKSARPQISFHVPMELLKGLAKNKRAQAFFDQLAPSYQKQFIAWIAVAKRPKTRERRINESIQLLARGEKLGMK
jgi:uncharacterized protein YdeI (YjbR/CyaY-like superfamily)